MYSWSSCHNLEFVLHLKVGLLKGGVVDDMRFLFWDFLIVLKFFSLNFITRSSLNKYIGSAGIYIYYKLLNVQIKGVIVMVPMTQQQNNRLATAHFLAPFSQS